MNSLKPSDEKSGHAGGSPGPKPLSDTNVRLLTFVERFGRVPKARGEAKAFWDKAYAEWCVWCKQEGHPPYKSADVLRTVYERLHKSFPRRRMLFPWSNGFSGGASKRMLGESTA